MPWDSRDERKKRARVAASEAIAKERHRQWDLQAKDTTMKYMRPSFSVVGEGTKEATDLYRKNYELIDWTQKPLKESKDAGLQEASE